MKKNTSRLTEGPIPKHLLGMSLPMMLGIFAVIAFNVVDTYFVGLLGTKELAAISLTFPVVFFFGSMAIGMGVGTSSVISRTFGSGDENKTKQQTTYSLMLALLLVSVFLVIGMLSIDPLFLALGANQETLPLVRQYMEIWYVGMFFLVVPMVGNSIIRSLGDARFPAMVMVGAGLINAILDPILIFGWLGVPKLGLRGAALATVFSRFLAFLAMLWYLHSQRGLLLWEMPLFANVRKVWKEVLRIGVPAMISQVAVPLSSAVITSIVAKNGNKVLAGFGAATRIESLSLIGLFALSSGMSPIVGQNWGAEKYGRIQEALKTAMKWSVFYGLFVTTLLFFMAPYIAALFNPEAKVIATTTFYLRVVPLSFCSLGIAFQITATFNAIGRPVPSMLILLTRTFLFCSLFAYLGQLLWKSQGIFIGVAVGNFLGGVLAFVWWHRLKILQNPEQVRD